MVAERVDLLANLGHMLRMPHARPLGEAVRTTFRHVPPVVEDHLLARPDGVIVLLTVFHKQRDNEAREVARARRALGACRAAHATS